MGGLKKMFERNPFDLQKEKEKELQEEQRAIEFEEMKKQLEVLQKEKASRPKTVELGDIFSIKQQLLVLDYLGAFEKINKIDNAQAKALFLKQLFNKSAQNIRTELSPINISELKYSTSRTKREAIRKNLIKVSELFEELGLKNIVKKVNEDIQKLDQ
jgi:hypothetical protein